MGRHQMAMDYGRLPANQPLVGLEWLRFTSDGRGLKLGDRERVWRPISCLGSQVS